MSVALLYGKLSLHAQRFWLNDDAPHSIDLMSSTELTSHFDKSLENLEAPLNIFLIVVTLEVFQEEILLSKDDAPRSIHRMSSTELTSHFDKSLENLEAELNIFLIVVTSDVCHNDKSLSKEVAPRNMKSILVTEETSQLLISELKVV